MSEKLDLKKETAKATRGFCFTHSRWVEKGKGGCREVGEKAVRQLQDGASEASWGVASSPRAAQYWDHLLLRKTGCRLAKGQR